jgi:hypothetical protein
VGEELHAAVVAMTRAVFHSGSGLLTVPLEGFPATLTKQFLAMKGPPGKLGAQVELEIARAFALHTDKMAERCLELARMALEISPGETVLRFLNRLGRCYIAGFFPESVVMCRAVLENAVLERFEREGKPLPVPAPGKSEMRARLARAEDHGWLTRKQRTEAWSIWERESKAAHHDPAVTTAVLDNIRTTVELLAILYQPDRRAA